MRIWIKSLLLYARWSWLTMHVDHVTTLILHLYIYMSSMALSFVTNICSKPIKMKIILQSILIFHCCVLYLVSAQLQVGFYSSTCPQAETTVRQAVQTQFNSDPSITAALLRMHFHDCFVRVSVLLTWSFTYSFKSKFKHPCQIVVWWHMLNFVQAVSSHLIIIIPL